MVDLERPYLLPKWEEQFELEREMLELGSARMRTKIQNAKDKRDMNRLRPHRNLLTEWVEPLAKTITKWVELRKTKRGPKPIALPLIDKLGSEVCAMVTLKVVLRMLGLEKRGLLTLAFEIGTWLEHEDRAAVWIESDPDGWNGLKRSQARRGATASHKKRSRVAIFNKHVKDDTSWSDWTHNQKRHVGLVLLDQLCHSTKRFAVVKDKTVRRKGKQSYPYILQADASLMSWLDAALDAEELHKPAYMPTIIPPKPWVGPRDGGYWTPYVKAPFLIRFKASNEDQRQRAIDEYEAFDMPMVYEALNNVQNTPWIVNRKVYELATKVWDNDLAIAGFTRKEPEVVPERPHETETRKEVWRDWKKAASATHTRNSQLVSSFISHSRTLVTAKRFLDEDEFYFPHILDFRGRMYPLPSDLQPQGGDLQRGLLTFKNGVAVSDEASAWLAVHLANTWGNDKLPFNERIAWVYANEAMWRSIASSPLDDRRWADKDKAWQVYAAVLEWTRWLDEGAGMISALPIHVDGTCNGIQHLSAMVRDEVGGASVNLLPSDEPRDIYQEVADTLTELVEASESDTAARWLKLVDGHFKRDITKRPVMILPYGGTQTAYIQYTLEWLKEEEKLKANPVFPEDEQWEASRWLANIMWHAIGDKVDRAREVMQWIKSCSAVAAKSGLPVYWSTPAGFIVRHFYGKREEKNFKTLMDDTLLQLTHWEISPTLDTRAQSQGISPNFVHSMDASALMSSVNLAKSMGVESITTIHDAYGAPAGDMFKLSEAIREAFEQTYSRDVLEDFRESCADVTGDLQQYPQRPPFGTLDIGAVTQSDYFFA